MSRSRIKSVALGCASFAVLLVATAGANAGGLAVREQSAYGQGSSYAGVAAGGSLSSMFWNPATMTQVYGIQSESVLSGLLASSKNSVTSGTYAGAPFNFGGTGNIAHSAIVPSSYYSWQFNQKLWLGLSINAPFGLAETFPDNWAGRVYGAGGENLSTYNFTPTVAYKFNDLLSVGFGVQIQYATAAFTQGIPGAPGLTNQLGVSGAGFGYGFTAGVTLTPTPYTTIGLGWRSGINQKINGTLVVPAAFAPVTTAGSVNTTFNMPDIVSLGLRQKLTPLWTGLATVEWSNWSRAGTSRILQPNGASAVIGATQVVIPFEYKDGWFFSLGAEYQWNPQLALRAGVAYELSPVTDQVRGPAIPDANRTWLSVGATYQYSAKVSLDFAYSHVFVKAAPISITNSSNPFFAIGGGTSYVGSVDSHLDVISVALKYRWDDPPAPAKVGYFKAK